MTYRSLTDGEIGALEADRCSCADWARVRVAENFRAGNLRDVAFSGDVRLGRFEGRISLPGGLEVPSGIQNATLHNCTVGDGVLIRNIGRHIANYDIGDGVTATDFIMCSGSRVEDSAILSDCFVGQGVRMGRQIAAENCLFFANCEALHGETCSVFAGPYTVTHHKSSLLIAGLFSFYNAGSGTNMSNHMYKLGPLLQGILERGSKTGSKIWGQKYGDRLWIFHSPSCMILEMGDRKVLAREQTRCALSSPHFPLLSYIYIS